MISSSDNSVYNLIQELCKSIISDVTRIPSGSNCTNRFATTKFLKKCQTLTYEILLKKSNCLNDEQFNAEYPDPFKELYFIKYETLMQTNEKHLQKQRSAQFDKCLATITGEQFFRTELGENILKILIRLRNCAPDDEVFQIKWVRFCFNISSLVSNLPNLIFGCLCRRVVSLEISF